MAHKSAPLAPLARPANFASGREVFLRRRDQFPVRFVRSISAALAQMKSEFIGLFGAEEESGERSLNWLLVVLQSTRPLASSAC